MTFYRDPFKAESESLDKTTGLAADTREPIETARCMNQPLALDGPIVLIKNNRGSGEYFDYADPLWRRALHCA